MPTGSGRLTASLALVSCHEVVAVAVAASKPEVCAFGGDDVKVVAWCPSGARSGRTGQGADRAFD